MDQHYSLIQSAESNIILYLFHNKSLINYPICLISSSSNDIYQLISIHDIFLKLSLCHLLYLAQEVYKAELSSILGQQYIQS